MALRTAYVALAVKLKVEAFFAGTAAVGRVGRACLASLVAGFAGVACIYVVKAFKALFGTHFVWS